jgi:fatty-acyl-CoA synthase
MSRTEASLPQVDFAALAERRAKLESRFPTWESVSLGERLDRCAEEFGDRPFVITDEKTFTYQETRDLADRLADGLHSLGVRPGDHVGILMSNFPEFIPVKFAAAKVGAVAVPLNFLYKADELAYVLAQSECRVLITMTGFANLDYPAMLDSIAPGWDRLSGGVLDTLPYLRHVVQLSTDGRLRDGVLSVDDLAVLGGVNAGATEKLVVPPDTIGDILYTSGTTGLPKGVLVTHDAVQRTSYGSALTRAYEDGRRILFSLPCYHMFGYLEGIVSAMMVGGAVILQTSFSPAGYLKGIQDHRATDILAVPTMAVAMLEYPDKDKYDLSSLNAILCGAAPGPAWLWERVASELGATEIVTGYGMTECGGAMTLSRPEDSYQTTATTAGRAKSAGVAGLADRDGDLTWYRTVDPDTGEFLPDGEVGELVSWGPTMMLGYWHKPEESAKALQDGWVFSGDLGQVHEDGYLELTGRSKELYKSGGELIMPIEIEALLATHPAISQVYAIGVPDDRWGDAGMVCIVLAPDGQITEDEVFALCKASLAKFKVPKHVWFLEASELPMTPTGKVQKFKLVERARTRLEQKSDSIANVR